MLETPGSPFTTLETVLRLTPASAATSRIVGRRPRCAPRFSGPAVSGSWLSMPAAPLVTEIDIPPAENLPRGCVARRGFRELAPSGDRAVTESTDLT
ncbi:hypothetical protein JCM9957A_28020 [Kineosporia succinea]